MDDEKRYSRQIIGKKIVSRSGKVFGEVNNLMFEIRTGEVLQLVLRNPTGYCEGLDLEKTKQGEILIPYSAVVALGDCVVVAEEEII